MASPHTPTITVGASGLETLASTCAALQDAAVIEGKTRTSLTWDMEKDIPIPMDNDKGKSKDMHLAKRRRPSTVAADQSMSNDTATSERISK
ncbi:hypothetical protein BGZ76_001507, partial [Entomortierella beljakovae]